MPFYSSYADTAFQSIAHLVGELFLIEDEFRPDADPIRVQGVFDETIVSSFEGDVPVLVFSPNVLFRNVDTGTVLEDRNRYTITRVSDMKRFIISDIDRDEVSTTRYLLEEEKNG